MFSKRGKRQEKNPTISLIFSNIRYMKVSRECFNFSLIFISLKILKPFFNCESKKDNHIK